MKGDGLYKRPKSPFWYFQLKENGHWREVSTKTSKYQEAKRKRRIPLNSDAMRGFRLLLDRASTLGIGAPGSYVFPSCEHSHIDATRPQKTWRTSWRKLTRAAGLKGLRFHDLRHQCVTELLEAGAPEAAVLSIAGHVSRKMMEHYSHIRMEAKRKTIGGLTPVAAVDSEAGAGRPRVN